MSTSIAAPTFVARKPSRSARKVGIANLIGTAAITCVVVGCGVTVYSNIFGASVYPAVSGATYDEPVVRRVAKLATREAAHAVHQAFAALPEPGAVVKKSEPVAPLSASMFNDRFGAAAAQGIASRVAEAPTETLTAADKLAQGPKLAQAPKLAEASRSPAKVADAARAKRVPAEPTTQVASLEAQPAQEARQESKPRSGLSIRDMADRAKQAVLSIGSDRGSMVEKLWGKPQPGLLAYASADASVTASIAPKEQNPMLGGSPPYDRSTAVYDISRKTVYLPDGTKLEAHSGLGSNLDDPHSAKVRMRGVTPPHIYELKPREALFHGVPALRLLPVGGESAIYGRDGLLAHTFMLGPNGDSNGCVSFRDYYAFLDAYRSKGIRKLAVLARVD